MPKHYAYTQRRLAPPLHRHILIQIALGRTDEKTAKMCDVSVDTVRKVREHDCNAEWLQENEECLLADQQLLQLQQDQSVRGALDLQRAVLNTAMEYDEDGEPKLKMDQKRDGSHTTYVPPTLLKSMMHEPLDHDPQGRFTKKITVNKGKVDKGFGGQSLSDFKKMAIMQGFTPPQVVDAEFTVVEHEERVSMVTAKDVVDIGVEDSPIEQG